MTPREAAIKLIAHSVKVDKANGRTLEQIIAYLSDSCFGHCSTVYWAQIGGYHSINGKPKKIQPYQIIVKQINHVVVNQIFDLRILARELYDETPEQASLWEGQEALPHV